MTNQQHELYKQNEHFIILCSALVPKLEIYKMLYFSRTYYWI